MYHLRDHLHLQAWIVDTIAAMHLDSDAIPGQIRLNLQYKSWLRTLLANLIKTFVVKYPLPWSRERAIDFCEALLGIQQGDFLQDTSHWTNVYMLLVLLPTGLIDRCDFEGLTVKKVGDYRELASALALCMLGRTLGVTSRGDFVSIPMNTAEWSMTHDYVSESIKLHRQKYAPRPGDVIGVPLGSRLPFLLRPCNQDDSGARTERHYELLETCYMPSLNDGRFVERLDIEPDRIIIV